MNLEYQNLDETDDWLDEPDPIPTQQNTRKKQKGPLKTSTALLIIFAVILLAIIILQLLISRI